MIVKTNFFKNEIYLPHAKASITDSVTDVELKVEDFINRYEREGLEKCLGSLSKEFFENIDASEPTLIKAGSDVKWDWLMNGHEYQDSKGRDISWLGIRRKIAPLGVDLSAVEYNYSFLAEYIYFNYEANSFITRADSGNVKVKPANAYVANSMTKVVDAWNRFVDAVQGDGHFKTSWFKTGFLGGYAIDYRGFDTDQNIPLYQFINDMNSQDPTTYKNFNPLVWTRLNKMTI